MQLPITTVLAILSLVILVSGQAQSTDRCRRQAQSTNRDCPPRPKIIRPPHARRQSFDAALQAISSVIAPGQAHQAAVDNLGTVLAGAGFVGTAADQVGTLQQQIVSGVQQALAGEVTLENAIQQAQSTFAGADGGAAGAFGK